MAYSGSFPCKCAYCGYVFNSTKGIKWHFEKKQNHPRDVKLIPLTDNVEQVTALSPQQEAYATRLTNAPIDDIADEFREIFKIQRLAKEKAKGEYIIAYYERLTKDLINPPPLPPSPVIIPDTQNHITREVVGDMIADAMDVVNPSDSTESQLGKALIPYLPELIGSFGKPKPTAQPGGQW